MYFAFIDESGKPNPGDSDKRPTLTAVCVKDREIKRVTQAIYSAELSSFGGTCEEKRKLKGNDMVHRRSMKHNYNNRKEYTEKVVDIITITEAYVFAIVMEKPDFKPYEKKGLLPVQYRYLLERLNTFGSYTDEQVLLVYDKVDDKDDGLIAEGIKSFLFTHGVGKQFNNIVHMPLFVSSINNPLIRLPDMSGNILRHYYGLELDQVIPSNEFEQWVNTLTHMVKSRTLDLKNLRGSYDYGIYSMRKDLFPRNKEDLIY